MKALILAGGFGTRFSEESHVKPKPMIEIGGKPILWHIMKIYSAYGINQFIICCGYKGHVIKEYFANYFLYMSDVTFNMNKNQMEIHKNSAEPWRVTLVDTGLETMTGGRIKRVKSYIGNETFCMTYGDSVANIDIKQIIDFHKGQKTFATVVAVQRPGRFGSLILDYNQKNVLTYKEKPKDDGSWTNGGFFVLEPEVMNYIKGDETAWEEEPLEKLARDGMLSAYKHNGFLFSMDTLRDKHVLEELWQSGEAPWKVW